MRCVHLLVSLSVALFGAACGGGGDGPGTQPPPPLEVASVTPAPDAADVETGATVAVVFNQAIDPATLTPATFRVKLGGVPLPAAVDYDAATRTARLVAPFLPDATYEAEVTTAVRTPAGGTLSAAQVWDFTTRRWQAVTVEGGGVGRYSSLGVDGSGRLHVSYFDGANGDLRYATCAPGCATAASWQPVTADSAGSVGRHTSLLVDGSGRLHVTYADNTDLDFDLKYATCAADCVEAANWEALTVDSAGRVGETNSLVVDANGRLHVTYFDGTNIDLK